MIKRRDVLVAVGSGLVSLRSLAGDPWGKSQGYPSGWGNPPSFFLRSETRVANYSGGFEQMVPFNTIKAPPVASPLRDKPREVRFRSGLFQKSPSEYLESWPITGLLIARKGDIWFEGYGFDRKPEMRFTGWSMSKSITSLLLGICCDLGLITSLEDPAERYSDALKGTFHGRITLRNLLNMSTGLALSGDQIQDNAALYPAGLWKKDSDVVSALATYNTASREQGQAFLYNDMAAIAVGLVVRGATGKSLSKFCEEKLWGPLGAGADATWLTDSKGVEFNCIGFAATLRDWARVGQLVAQRGQMNGKQVVSEDWIRECTSWGEKDQQVRVNYARSGAGYQLRGYKAFFWHLKSDGSQPVLDGFHGQRIYIDLPTKTVMVQTAIDHGMDWRWDSEALFDAASNLLD